MAKLWLLKMKSFLSLNKTMLNKKSAGFLALLASFAVGDILYAGSLASPNSYTAGDVLVCFRKSGGANDLVVDAGPVSTLTNATVNQVIPITQFSGSQLAKVGTNGISWSAFTWFDNSFLPSSVQYTLFVSKGRTSVGTQTTPWVQQSQNSQKGTALTMSVIPAGAGDCRNYQVVNSDTAVVEPDDINNVNVNYLNGQSYYGTLGANLDFSGKFTVGSDTIECNTAANFITAGVVARSDFYQIPPRGNGSVKFLGYFELSTNGALTYVAYPSLTAPTPTVPVIKSISRNSGISSVSFTTGTFGTYTLRGTNSAGFATARTNWPAISSITGNGSILTLQDTTSLSSKFYVITAQ